MYSLFIDTHDKNVIVILFKDGKILKKEDIVSSNKHSEITMPTLDNVLSSAKVNINDINNIIIVNGPGSFTGERIAVTIGKTIAYCLNLPIRVIDSLTILALNIEEENKIVALEDRNGAYIGCFKKLEKTEEFQYMPKSQYEQFKIDNNVITNPMIDYEKVYQHVMLKEPINPHSVKPLYIKGISAQNGK